MKILILLAAMAGAAAPSRGHMDVQHRVSTTALDTPSVQAPLPTGFSFAEIRHVLSRLEPVEPEEAEAAAQPATSDPTGLQISGLVVDETASKIGRDFYDVFYSAWEAPPGATGFTIRIQEQPSPGLGTRVVLLLDDEPLFQLQLQPRYDAVEALAQQAAAYTRQELQRRQPAEMPTAAGSAAEEGDGGSTGEGNGGGTDH